MRGLCEVCREILAQVPAQACVSTVELLVPALVNA